MGHRGHFGLWHIEDSAVQRHDIRQLAPPGDVSPDPADPLAGMEVNHVEAGFGKKRTEELKGEQIASFAIELVSLPLAKPEVRVKRRVAPYLHSVNELAWVARQRIGAEDSVAVVERGQSFTRLENNRLRPSPHVADKPSRDLYDVHD